MASSTATPEAQAALAVTPTRDLLRAAYTLTHRIHSEQDHGGVTPEHAAAKRAHIADLRAQRDLIDAEIERRTGGVL